MEVFNRRQKFLLSCAGVDLDTMAECTSAEVNKYLLIGTCVLIPTALALFTGGYTVFIISKNIWASMLIAPLWAWVIFTLDRTIVANTITNEITWSVFGRFCLALGISVLISQPVELIAFKDVIKDKKRTELQKKIDIACIKSDSLINLAKIFTNKLDTATINKRLELRSEINIGNPIARRRDGYGRHARFLQRQLTADSLANERMKSIANKYIDSLNFIRASRVDEVRQNDPDGLLGQLELLHSLAKENFTVKLAVWFLFAFFLIIELIPIIVKIDSNSSELDLYNKIKNGNNQNCLDVHDKIKKQREELFVKEQLLMLNNRVQKIDLLIRKKSIKEIAGDYKFYMQTVEATGEELNKAESSILKKVKNEIVRQHLLAQVLRIFFKFSKSLEAIINKDDVSSEPHND